MVDCWRAQFISGCNLFLTFSTASIIAFQLDFDRLRGTNLPEPSWSSNFYNTASALCSTPMFPPQASILFQIRSGASDCSSTGAVIRALAKNDYALFTLRITADLELLVLIFSIYITSVSLPYKAFRDTQEFAKSLNTSSRCGIVKSLEIFTSQLDTALIRLP